MRFGINILMVGVAVFVSWSIKPKQNENIEGVLVFQRSSKLEGVWMSTSILSVLRNQFDVSSENWSLAPDGRQLVFSEVPQDVDFFNAGSYRNYMFLSKFDTAPRVLLAAYGSRAVYPQDRPTFLFPKFNATGQKVIVQEEQVGQFMQSASPHWASIYDVQTRKRVFDSREFVKRAAQGELRETLKKSLLNFPSLSPDGKDLVCFATPDDGDSLIDNYKIEQKAPDTLLIHFDLQHNRAEKLSSLDDQFSVARIGVSPEHPDNIQYPVRVLNPQFAWHPTQRKFVFVGPTSPTSPTANLFTFDLNTRKMTRVSQNQQDDFSPQWSLDGKHLLWIRGTVHSTLRSPESHNRIFRADADGSNAIAILPQVKGVSRIQLLPQLADWGRYRKLSVEPLAGADK